MNQKETKVCGLLVFMLLEQLLCLPQAKHLQFVSGVYVTSYWLATFAWDMLNAMVPVILTFILFAAFQVDGYKDEGLGAILLILVIDRTQLVCM